MCRERLKSHEYTFADVKYTLYINRCCNHYLLPRAALNVLQGPQLQLQLRRRRNPRPRPPKSLLRLLLLRCWPLWACGSSGDE